MLPRICYDVLIGDSGRALRKMPANMFSELGPSGQSLGLEKLILRKCRRHQQRQIAWVIHGPTETDNVHQQVQIERTRTMQPWSTSRTMPLPCYGLQNSPLIGQEISRNRHRGWLNFDIQSAWLRCRAQVAHRPVLAWQGDYLH